MEELLLERENYYTILSQISDVEIDFLVEYSQTDWDDEYFNYLHTKKRRIGEFNMQLYTHIKPMSKQIENFYLFSKRTNLPLVIIEEIKDYYIKSIIDESLYNKIYQIHIILKKIKSLIENRLLDGYPILDNIEESNLRINDENLLFSEEEKENIKNNINNHSLLRHETMIGNEIVDMDAKNISYNGLYFTKDYYMNYFKLILNEDYLNHLVFLFLHKWQIKINQSTEIIYYYGAIQRIKPSEEHFEFIVRMKEIYLKLQFILHYLDFE